jgi:ribosomal RNA-processing protein 36
MDELRELKQKLRGVVSATAPKASRAVYKRENKNRPREVSAKRRERVNQTRIIRRDPRFEESCGQLDEDQFNKDYDFLNEIREKEKKMLAKAAKKEKDPEKREELVKLKQRIDNQSVSQQQRQQEKEVIEQLKNQQKEKTGSTYVKRSDVKSALLVQKFQQLKKSGKLKKYLEKKRKKNVAKDRKMIE